MKLRATKNRVTGLPMRLALAATVAAIFTAAANAGVPTARYDFSNTASLFQDSTGMTPVTNAEQSIGYVVDQSKGGAVRSPEMMLNPGFLGSAGWNLQSTAAVVNNQLVLTAAAPGVIQASNTTPVVIGRVYEVTFDLISFSSGGVSVGTGGGGVGIPRNAPGTYREIIQASAVAVGVYSRSTTTTAVVDNVSVKELIGPNIWSGALGQIDANWTDNGNGSYTSNGSNGFLGWASAAAKLVPGRTYEAIIRVTARTAGTLYLPYDGAGANNSAQATAAGLYRRIFTAISTGLWIYSAAFAGSVDFMMVNELPGIHLNQPTAASRPVLDARVNQLLYSQDYSNAAGWAMTTLGTGVAPTVTPAYAVAPDGTNTANRVQFSTGSGTTNGDISQVTAFSQPTAVGGTYTSGIWLKSNTGANQTIHVTDITGATTAIVVTPTWQQFTLTRVATATASIPVRIRLSGNAATSADIQAWGAQFETGSTLGKYQRITTATDYDWQGYAGSARFNGTSSAFLTTVGINMSFTNRVTVVTAHRKTSDAARACLYEFSPVFTNAGSFTCFGSWTPGPDYLAGVTGASASLISTNPTGMPAPHTAVMSLQGNLASGTPVSVRVNGATTTTNGATGGGNFGTYSLYIGARNNASNYFTGRLYTFDLVGAYMSPTDLNNTEQLARNKLNAVTA